MKRFSLAFQPPNYKCPLHGWLGLILVILFWILNWTLTGLRTHLGFFPLWLGYSLLVDALVFMRKGTSLFTRSRTRYVQLFLISAPAWWLFEIINLRTQNWYYDGRHFFSDLEYFILASVSFSTVMPAVFGTAELVSAFLCFSPKNKKSFRIIPNRGTLLGFFTAGWTMLFLILLEPKSFFPFVWISLYFILEPVNIWLKNRSLADYTAQGNWRPVQILWLGALICGFFWELWNYYSYPKWIYHIPVFNILYIFEMPLLGYGGYLPFGLELFALYHLIYGFINKQESKLEYIQIRG